MPKGSIQESRTPSAPIQFRDAIRELEIGAANVQGRKHAVLDLLKLRSHLEQERVRLERDGLDLRPERTRLDTVDNILRRKAGTIMQELRAVGGLPQARRTEQPSEEHWWWYLDHYWLDRQRRRVVRVAATVAGVLVLVLGVNLLLDRFFGLSPAEKEARVFSGQAEQYLLQGERAQAITEYERAIAVLPSYSEAYVALAVLYETEGRIEASHEALATAEELIGDRAILLMALARSYEQVGEFDVAMARVEEAILLEPDSAQAYLIRGGLEETLGDTAKAIDDFEHASTLASEQGEDALYVLARTRMAMLMQKGSGGGIPGGGGF